MKKNSHFEKTCLFAYNLNQLKIKLKSRIKLITQLAEKRSNS